MRLAHRLRALRPSDEVVPGLAMMAAAALGFAWANSPWSEAYRGLLHLELAVRIGDASLAKPLLLWVNEGLMALFFLLVGLEIKREVVEGSLASVRQAVLPAAAAIGGMVVPAAIYVAINAGDAAAIAGWAIPTATDIAFAVGALALVGRPLPAGLKTFLLTLAVLDDLGAIVVIAVFYTPSISSVALALAGAALGALVVLHRVGVQAPAPYFLLGALLWLAVLKSGAHATLAGVLLAWTLPMRGADAPAHAIERALVPWIGFGVLPLFAFANAGVRVVGDAPVDWLHGVPLGIALGLLLGKPLGVSLGAWLAVRAGARLPDGVGPSAVLGAAMLAGIGFTMSLFVQTLAFGDDLARGGADKLAILAASLVAGALGWAWLRYMPIGRLAGR